MSIQRGLFWFFSVLSFAPIGSAQSTFDDVHPVFRMYCADCHSAQGNGAHNIAGGDIAAAYADSQLASYSVVGQTKGFAALFRIQNGDMPLGAGCSGNPTIDAGNPACLTAADLARIQLWLQDGQLPPLPLSGATFCFGDGSGTTCPCPLPSDPDGGCRNSVSWPGGKLVAAGTASLTSDELLLRASRMPNGAALFIQGTERASNGLGIVFGDGLLCVSGSVMRLGAQIVHAGAAQFPPPSGPALSVSGAIQNQGTTRHYQVWYRDSANYCQPATFNLTNGVTVTWGA